jgi:hypothetical protein
MKESTSQLVRPEGVSKHAKSASALCYLSLSLDGDQWCALFGPNLQDGVAGFGTTPTDAVNAFDKEFKTRNEHSDWSAWIEGCEDWKVGFGPDELSALRDLLSKIEGS